MQKVIIRNQSLKNLICLILIIHTHANSDGKNSSNEGVVPILELLKNLGGLLKNFSSWVGAYSREGFFDGANPRIYGISNCGSMVPA